MSLLVCHVFFDKQDSKLTLRFELLITNLGCLVLTDFLSDSMKEIKASDFLTTLEFVLVTIH